MYRKQQPFAQIILIALFFAVACANFFSLFSELYDPSAVSTYGPELTGFVLVVFIGWYLGQTCLIGLGFIVAYYLLSFLMDFFLNQRH